MDKDLVSKAELRSLLVFADLMSKAIRLLLDSPVHKIGFAMVDVTVTQHNYEIYRQPHLKMEGATTGRFNASTPSRSNGPRNLNETEGLRTELDLSRDLHKKAVDARTAAVLRAKELEIALVKVRVDVEKAVDLLRSAKSLEGAAQLDFIHDTDDVLREINEELAHYGSDLGSEECNHPKNFNINGQCAWCRDEGKS